MILRGQDSKVLRGVSGEVLTPQDPNLILKMKWDFGVDKTGSDVNSIQNQWYKSTRLIPVNLKPTENGDGIFFNSYQNALRFIYPLQDLSSLKIKVVYKIPTGSALGQFVWFNEVPYSTANRVGFGFEGNVLKYYYSGSVINGNYTEPKDQVRRAMIAPAQSGVGGGFVMYLYQQETQYGDDFNYATKNPTATQPLQNSSVGGVTTPDFGTPIHIYYIEVSINNDVPSYESRFDEWAEFRDKPLSEL